MAGDFGGSVVGGVVDARGGPSVRTRSFKFFCAFSPLVAQPCGAVVPAFASWHCGVGYFRHAGCCVCVCVDCGSEIRAVAVALAGSGVLPVSGVGRRPAALSLSLSLSLSRVIRPSPDLGETPLRLLFPLIVTVGQASGDPDSLALVSRSNVRSGQHVPQSIIPDRGQVPENESQSP